MVYITSTTLVFISGPKDFNLEIETITHNGIWLNKVSFEKDVPKIISVKCTSKNIFLIDINFNLWGLGESNEGQLIEKVESMKYPINITKILETKFQKIQGNEQFIVALSSKLYIWGNVPNHLKQLTKRVYLGKNIQVFEFTKLFEEPIQKQVEQTQKQIDLKSIQIFEDQLYLLNQNGQLFRFSKQINIQEQFIGISCGSYHILAWQENGRIWSWGEYANGKLGYMRFDVNINKEPKIVSDFTSKAIQCCCGGQYSIALDTKGDIYTWGKGPFNLDLSIATMPTLIMKRKSPFIKISSGFEHFGALNSAGQIYIWGSNKKDSLFNIEDELINIPKLLDLKCKIIDFDMGGNHSVLIEQVDKKIPLLNFNNFKNEKYKVVQEETNLIQQYVNKKNAMEFQKQISGTVSQPCSPQLSPLKLAPLSQLSTFVSQHSLTERNSVHFPILFDKIQQEINKLESVNQLYIKIESPQMINHTREQSQQDLNSILVTDNDQLKYEYIQMVKENDDDQMMLNVLNYIQSPRNQISLKIPERVHMNQFRLKYQQKKPIFHDKYDQYDNTIIEKAKQEVLQSQRERQQKILNQKRRIQLGFCKISQQSLQIQPIQSKEELLCTIKKRAYDNNKKFNNALQKKIELESIRTISLQEKLYEKSLEYKIQMRQQQKFNQLKQYCFQKLLQYLNEEQIFQLFSIIPQFVMDQRRNEFHMNVSASKIQHYFRKKYILIKILNNLGPISRKVLQAFIVRYKLKIRIKKKRQRIRKINLFNLKQSISLKIYVQLKRVVQATISIQLFCKWYNNIIVWQLNQLNQCWDDILKKKFKSLQLDQEKEQLKALQLQYQFNQINNFQYQQPILQFPKKPLMQGKIIRQFVLNQLQKYTTKQRIKKISNPLLPYTRYYEEILIPQKFRIPLNYTQIQQYNIMEELIATEQKVKNYILNQHLKLIRQQYFKQMYQFYQSLLNYKNQNIQNISTTRIKILSKLSPLEILFLQQLDKKELEKKIKKPSPYKLSLVIKNSIIRRINVFNEDQYPYIDFTFHIIRSLNNEQIPQIKLELDEQQWIKLFEQYFREFRVQSQRLISRHIQQTTSKLQQRL